VPTQEDAQLLECHRKHGNKWTLIAQEIGGRTDNAVKNRWAALEKKRHIDDAGYLEQQHRASYSRGGGDLLGVRRIIAKDQPQRSYTSRQQGMLEAAYWMQEGYAAAAAAAAAAEQQDQGMYGMQMAALGSQQGRLVMLRAQGVRLRRGLAVTAAGCCRVRGPWCQQSSVDVMTLEKKVRSCPTSQQ
jgi:hypothetical protein